MEHGNHNFSSIQEKTILRYIDRMWQILPLVFISCAVVETGLFFFINGNQNTAGNISFFNKKWTIIKAYLPTIFSFIFYFPCLLLYKRKHSNFHLKKTYYQAILYLAASSYIFIHSEYTILLAMYTIPILTSCAFSKTAVKRSFFYSTLFIIIYAIFQTVTTHSIYYIPTSLIIELIVIFSSLIAVNINKQYHEAFEKMSQAMKYSAELTNKLHTDTLTNAFTREKLEEDIQSVKDRKNKFQTNSIAFIDIDNFKEINDKYGHDKGDWVLETFVWVVSEEEIKIYRFGGDEFILSSSISAEELYERLIYKNENFKYETKKHLGQTVTISCGIIHATDFTQEEIKRADNLMYDIKRTGKNLIKVLD